MRKELKMGYLKSASKVLCFLGIILSSACQKVINVDLNEAAPKIVIEGLITDRPGSYVVTLSSSGSYFNQPVLPPVSGAKVIITDNLGTIDTLGEMMPGVYVTSEIHGNPGRTYTLKVRSDNQEYSASSTMSSRVRIDSLNLSKSTSQLLDFGFEDKTGIPVDLYCYFRDPEEKNFYRLKVFINDTVQVENYRLYDDQYSNGMEIGLRVARGRSGSTYRIELFSLDSKTYNYYKALEDLLYNNPFFGSTPANPNTNLSNGALGYFGTSAVSSRTITITDSMLKVFQ
jgi:hypothetical protein